MDNFFNTKAVFSKEIFKPGIAVKIEGNDYDLEKVNFIGLIASNEGEYLSIIDHKRLSFDLFIEQTIGSPVFKKPRDAEEGFKGFKITILEDPEERKTDTEPKKKGGYKLSGDDIKNIRKLHSRYMVPQAEIARIFGVVASTISEIVNFVTHKDIK